MAANAVAISTGAEARSITQGAVVVLGRFFFALIFLVAAPNHFTRQTIAFSASQGVPFASILVPLSDRKSTRLNSSHGYISYAVFCLKKKKKETKKWNSYKTNQDVKM